MPYELAGEIFSKKEEITERCRHILAATPDGATVNEESMLLLFDLFGYHDEWPQKSAGGVCSISTMRTIHKTRCFVLVKSCGEKTDISFTHAIRLIPGSRSSTLLPQPLRDFKNGARTAVRMQIANFRDSSLARKSVCPLTGEKLTRGNSAVDHMPPNTFDRLLFDFCRLYSLNPLEAEIASLDGTVAVISSKAITTNWQNYHQRNANLRLLSCIGNLRLPKVPIPWGELFHTSLSC